MMAQKYNAGLPKTFTYVEKPKIYLLAKKILLNWVGVTPRKAAI